jgi:hypothetical protein
MSSLPAATTHVAAQGASSTRHRATKRPKHASPSYLLHPDPSAHLQVELVDHRVDLPGEQFDALLVDSECEV